MNKKNTIIEDFSMDELADEMKNRCQAQKETCMVIWSCPDAKMMLWRHTDGLGKLLVEWVLNHMSKIYNVKSKEN